MSIPLRVLPALRAVAALPIALRALPALWVVPALPTEIRGPLFSEAALPATASRAAFTTARLPGFFLPLPILLFAVTFALTVSFDHVQVLLELTIKRDF
ncbi:MAG: hypothetical protein H7X76_05285 [Prolixibacteraceae bacterium]|nr:hypothetical protein [Burkholderiales bacterium]